MRRKNHLTESDVTPESLFYQRRKILQFLGLSTVGLSLSPSAQASLFSWFSDQSAPTPPQAALQFTQPKGYLSPSLLTPEDKVTGYNNFYEFGLDKADPAQNAGHFRPTSWQLRIEGEVDKPFTLDLEDLLHKLPLEERIYRLRCVEAWSMVIPWVGLSLSTLLKRAQPNSRAKFVAFQTLYDPEQMPGQKSTFVGGGLNYPYVEGLRIDEAMHPLTLLSVGVYGKTLPPQNGTPVRLIVPWKYGFKSIKSLVSIRLTEQQPPTTWNLSAPDEYGFYANVNPQVDHPRWSQATERVIGSRGLLDVERRPTELFNGYAEQVASLYQGMNLKENF